MFLMRLSVLVSCVMVASGTDCPDWWLAFDGSCYLFGNTLERFTEAQQFCVKEGGNLIHVGSATENDFIRTYARDLHQSYTHNWWLGLTAGWRWVDTNTSATFLGWGQDQGISPGLRCAAISRAYDFKWQELICDSSYAIPLCEIRNDGSAVVVG